MPHIIQFSSTYKAGSKKAAGKIAPWENLKNTIVKFIYFFMHIFGS